MARRKNPESDALTDLSDPAPDLAPDLAAEPAAAAEALAERAVEPLPLASVSGSSRRSGLLAPVLGGALAAVGGFGLSHFNAFGLTGAGDPAEITALSGRLDALEAARPSATDPLPALRDSLSGLQARIDALEAAPAGQPVDLSALESLDQRMTAIEALPKGGGASTAALATKLAELERRLAAEPQGAADMSRVDEALARLEAAEAEATARAKAAAEAATGAERTAALVRLRAAVAGGAGFEAELAALGDPALNAALAPHVAGVATVATLQAEFPDLSRQALAIARAAEGDRGWGARLVDFLASQTGARSLSPRAGDTPDAILSRADFALSEARLPETLAELATLPTDARAPFAAWITRVEARQAVDAALEAL